LFWPQHRDMASGSVKLETMVYCPMGGKITLGYKLRFVDLSLRESWLGRVTTLNIAQGLSHLRPYAHSLTCLLKRQNECALDTNHTPRTLPRPSREVQWATPGTRTQCRCATNRVNHRKKTRMG